MPRLEEMLGAPDDDQILAERKRQFKARRPEYVYVASSWRNMMQTAVVAALRAAGIDCYDFRRPAKGKSGFSWSEIDPNWMRWTPKQWREALKNPIAQAGYRLDEAALTKADVVVLVLPSGRSAHIEAAYAAGKGKRVYTLALEPVEPELMNLLLGPAANICTTMDELFEALGVPN